MNSSKSNQTQIILHGISMETLIDELTARLAPMLAAKRIAEEAYKPDTEEFITRGEASKLLKLSVRTIAEHSRQGRLKPHRIGRRVLFRRSEVLATLKPARYE